MATLIVTRGLPGCGKSTWAKAWCAEAPESRVRVNRDDLRAMLHCGPWDHDQERRTQAVRDASITALLQRGVDVVVDDTNLPSRVVRDLRRLAVLARAEFQVQDMTNVPLETALMRNKVRIDKAPVPGDIVQTMHQKYIKGRPYPLVLQDEEEPDVLAPYAMPDDMPAAICVDIDGTLALKGDRSPYDESRVSEDRPNWPVVRTVQALWGAGYTVVIVSGRTEACREATEQWLKESLRADYTSLFMRKEGDMRKDAVVKAEIFDQEIRHNYRVLCVIDDRKQVVDMWRSMGLTVLQCAEGNF